jgi:hypothetical protein
VSSAGSRDNHIALWRIQDDDRSDSSILPSSRLNHVETSSLLNDGKDIDASDSAPLRVPSYDHVKPLCVKLCEKAEKVRAFAYNDHRQVCN